MPMQVVTPDEIQRREKENFTTEDGLSQVTHYFGGRGPDNQHPSAFLVEYRPVPGGAIRPHFHKVAQFQVVIGGDGRIGKVPVPPISFQYADPSTPYGPITPADEERGIDFLTLRPVARTGLWWMPGNHHELEGVLRRNRANTVSPDEPLPARGTARQAMIKPEDDGLAGYVVRLAPGAQELIEVPARSAGQYHLVTRGLLVHDGRTLARMSLLFADTGEHVTLTAGPDGGEVLVMQFPSGIEPEREEDR
jgi:hypothetical protein